jgi:hypothetical protein
MRSPSFPRNPFRGKGVNSSSAEKRNSSLRKKSSWVTLEDGTVVALPQSNDATNVESSNLEEVYYSRTLSFNNLIESLPEQEGEEVRFYGNDTSLREIDVDYGTYVIEYTGLKHIYNSTTSDCSKTPTSKIVVKKDESSDKERVTGFFRIGTIPYLKKDDSLNDQQFVIAITYISDDKRYITYHLSWYIHLLSEYVQN